MTWRYRDADRACADQLRAGTWEALERHIQVGLLSLPEQDEIRTAALATTSEEVVTSGWDCLNTTIAMLSRTTPITAVGIDITAHGDGKNADGHRIQYLETSYYADTRSFAFSSASREVLREACTQSTPAWVGDFVEIDDAIKVTGLDRLYDALTHREQACDRSDETAERALFYGSWLRHLRVHRAVQEGLRRHGLARDIPVIVATNESSPYVTVPYWPEHTVDCEAQADRAIAERDARNRAHYRKITDDTVAEWQERRSLVRTWPRWVNPRQRHNHFDFAKAHETVQRMDYPDLKGLPFSFEGSDADFAYLAALYRHLRDPTQPRPARPGLRSWIARLRRR